MDKDGKTAKQLDALCTAITEFQDALERLVPRIDELEEAGKRVLFAGISVSAADGMQQRLDTAEENERVARFRERCARDECKRLKMLCAELQEQVAELEKREDDARLRECVARTDWTRTKAHNAELKKENSELRQRISELLKQVDDARHRERAAQSELTHLRAANCELRAEVRALHTELAELAEAKVNQGKRDDASPDLPKRVRDALRENGFDAEFDTFPWRDGVVVVFSDGKGNSGGE